MGRTADRRHRGRLALALLTAVAASLAFVPRLSAQKPASPRGVVLLGLDGADWLTIDPLVAAGELPNMARLKARGRTGILLATPPLLSPIIWTTIATGRRPEDHRILDFMIDLPSGGQAPVPSTERRVAALWNIFSGAGRTVSVVGWWATWPPEELRGTIVSDRVAPQLTRGTTAFDGSAISPAGQFTRLAPAVVRAADLRREDLAAYVPLTAAEFEAARKALLATGAGLYRDPIAHLAAIVASTRTYTAMAEALLASRPDLLLVYLESVDSLSHRFIQDPRRGPRAIAQAYRDADALLGRVAARSSPDTWIMICSDHGFYPADAAIREDPAELAGPATAWHRPYGIVAAIEARALVGGDGGARGTDVGTVTPLDIAPTLLHLAGLPVSREMSGRVVPTLLPPEAADRAVAHVPRFDPPRRRADAVPALSADPNAHERLQALGYVGASTTSLARLNLGEILYRRGDLAGAERELREVVEAQPRSAAALLWLAKAVRDQGRPRSALALYERVLALPGDNGDALVEAVELAVASGLGADARRIVAGFSTTPRTASSAAVARAIAAQSDGRPQSAERELHAALASDPTSAPALTRLLDLLVAAGRAREAIMPLERAVRAAPASARLEALLGEAHLAAGDAVAAEAALGQALRLAPDSGTLRIELARARLRQGRLDDASSTLLAAPPSVERDTLLGATRSRQLRWEEAARSFRAALERGPPTTELLNGLAFAEWKRGQVREAVALLESSLGLDRNQPEIDRLLAEIRRSEMR